MANRPYFVLLQTRNESLIMAKFELKLPKMGESVAEATITSWLKEVGDAIELDETVVEIATDKVDSEVPSEVEGTLVQILFDKDSVVNVGDTIAIIETASENNKHISTKETSSKETFSKEVSSKETSQEMIAIEKIAEKAIDFIQTPVLKNSENERFYSPLVRNIAQKEGISIDELETIKGSGKEARLTKNDILSYLKNKELNPHIHKSVVNNQKIAPVAKIKNASPITIHGEDEIIEMSRMGKLVSKHMINSVQTSAHVQSFIEIDVTNIVAWRNNVKDAFLKREGEKLTFTPIFMQAIASTIKKYPMINIAVDGDSIIKKKNINLGMAAALADGNLIVPVIKNADQLNLIGMTKAVNSLAHKARANQLSPDDVQDGTYTVTNIGSFGSVTGTPIINQPQVAILALGAIRKVPAVIETEEGDYIGIRQTMFVSHSYDHRVVNGALGGLFIKTLKDTLEAWDLNQEF